MTHDIALLLLGVLAGLLHNWIEHRIEDKERGQD